MSSRKPSRTAPSDFISRLSQNRQHIIALAILVILPVIMYSATVLGGKQYMGHDTLQWRAGAQSIIQYRQDTGDEALWATNMFSGMPAYVVSVQKFVPHIDAIFGFFHDIFPAFRYWVLLLGLYVFFLLQKIRPITASLGSVIIGFTTYIPIIIGAGHNTKFTAFVFIPWVLVGYWLLTRHRKRRLLSFFVFVVATTLEFRAGHPQVTYYFFYLLGIWWIYDGVIAYREGNINNWLKDTGWLAGAGLLAVLSNLQPYWSMMEYTPFSTRGGSEIAAGGGGLDLQYAFSWSQGWGEMLTLLIPGLFGGSSAEGTYWGPKSFTSGPHYFGAIAFVLFLLGLVLYRKRIKYLFTGVGVLTMLFSLGYHFPLLNEFMFRYMPYFNKFRTPEMWLIVTVFCFGVVAVYGAEALIDRVQEQNISIPTRPFYAALGISLFIGLIFAATPGTFLSFQKQGEASQYAQQLARRNNVSPRNPQVQQRVEQFIQSQLVPQRKEKAQSDAQRYLLLVVLAGGLIMAYRYEKIGPGFLALGLLLLISYDMISVGKRYMNEQALQNENIDIEKVVQSQGRPVDKFLQKEVPSGEGYDYRVFPIDRNPFNNAIPCYFYPSIGGYTGAKLSVYQDVVDEAMNVGSQGINLPVLNMLNVRYVTTRGNFPVPGWKQVYSQQDGKVYENTNVLPKAFFVDSLVYADNPGEALTGIKPDAGFDPAQYAIVEKADSELQTSADSTSSVEVTHYGPRRIRLTTQRSKPGYMVLSEIYYPAGWRAYIDGEQTPIYKTNYTLRGIEVPEGNHEIRFEFHPRSYFWGGRIAMAGNILQWLIGIVGLIGFYKSRTDTEE